MEETTLQACRDCGATARPHWQYCGECGGRLADPEPTPTPVAVAAAAADQPPVSAEQRFGLAPPTPGSLPAALAASSSRLEGLMSSRRLAVEAPVLPYAVQPALPQADDEVASVVPDVEPAATGPAVVKSAVKWSVTPKRAIVAVAMAAVVIAVAVLGINDRGTHHTLSTTRTRLATTAAALGATRTKVSDLTKQLDSIKSQLASTQSDLNAKTTELTGVRNSLTYANGQIDDLKTCLQGVLRADSYAADGYYESAVAALDAVVPVCQRVLKSV